MVEKYSTLQIQQQLDELNQTLANQWHIRDKKLSKVFAFNDFIGAFGFITQVAILSEKCNHHPTWSNTYNKVEINLSTHEVNGISSRDFELAHLIESAL